MTKNTWLKIVVPLLFISALIQILAGLCMALNIFAAKMDTFLIIHKRNAYVLIILIITHISLNWSWIKANLFKKQ